MSEKVIEETEAVIKAEQTSKTWKSTVAFFLFLVIYAYTVYDNRPGDVIDITGYIALISMAFMMLRDKRLGDLIDKIVSARFPKKD